MRGTRNRTIVGFTLVAIGVVLAVISALGDQLGGEEGFGWKQILGVAVGGAAVLFGLVIAGIRSPRTR